MKPEVLFPAVENPNASDYEMNIRFVIKEYGLEGSTYHLHVRPYYNSGASQCVKDPETLAMVAAAEQLTYEDAAAAKFGQAAADGAQVRGLRHICFITWRRGKHLYAYDVLTREISQVNHF